jgi:hypothetical protein
MVKPAPSNGHPIIEALLGSIVFSGLLGFSTYLIYNKMLFNLEREIKIGLLSSVNAAASTINGDDHKLFNAQTKKSDPTYQNQAGQLERIRQATQDVRYIYTNILQGDKVYFVVNPSPQNDSDGDGEPDPAPALMTQYQDYPPELLHALQQNQSIVTQHPYTDEWGTFISAYAPFYDSNGKWVGTLGMDLELEGFFHRVEPVQRLFEKTFMIIWCLGLALALVLWAIRNSCQRQVALLQQSQLFRAQECYEQQTTVDHILELTEAPLSLEKKLQHITDFSRRYQATIWWSTGT